MRKFVILYFTLICITITACSNKTKMPYGADNIKYSEIESINDNGPEHKINDNANMAPFADKVYDENGPKHIISDEKTEPTADFAEMQEFGDVPINIEKN